MFRPTETRKTKAMTVIVLIPALIAGVSAGLISQIGARWYEKESAK